MTGEEIKEYVHSQAELPFLERDNRGKGYICPCCGNGSGSSGDGIVKVPLSSSYKCFKCGESGDAFFWLGKALGIEGFAAQLEEAARIYGLTYDNKPAQSCHSLKGKTGERSVSALSGAAEDLLMFTSSHENKLTTLDEYVSRMKEEQKYIYYAAGDSVEKIQALPQTELLRDKGYEILYLTDNVDEFAVKVLMRHGDKEFRNVSEGDLGIDTEAEKEETKKLAEENKDMLSFITAALDGKVKETKISDKLKSHPVCISSSGQISLEMEKILNQNPQNEKAKSEKVLEINPNHKIFAAMQKLYGEDKEKFKDYASILYDQALLIEGMQIEDPVEFSNKICALMAE